MGRPHSGISLGSKLEIRDIHCPPSAEPKDNPGRRPTQLLVGFGSGRESTAKLIERQLARTVPPCGTRGPSILILVNVTYSTTTSKLRPAPCGTGRGRPFLSGRYFFIVQPLRRCAKLIEPDSFVWACAFNRGAGAAEILIDRVGLCRVWTIGRLSLPAIPRTRISPVNCNGRDNRRAAKSPRLAFPCPILMELIPLVGLCNMMRH